MTIFVFDTRFHDIRLDNTDDFSMDKETLVPKIIKQDKTLYFPMNKLEEVYNKMKEYGCLLELIGYEHTSLSFTIYSTQNKGKLKLNAGITFIVGLDDGVWNCRELDENIQKLLKPILLRGVYTESISSDFLNIFLGSTCIKELKYYEKI